VSRFAKHASQVLPVLLAVALFLFAVRSADLSRSIDLVQSLGFWLPLLLLPAFLAIAIESVGWWLSFSRLGPRPPFVSLLRVRLIGDALQVGLPSGAVIAESLQPYLLKRRCGVPFELGIVAGVARKFFVVASHALTLGAFTLAAWPALDQASRLTIGRRGLPWLLLGTAGILMATALASAALGARGRVGERLRVALDRFGGRWLGSWLERNALRFEHADRTLAAFFDHDRGALVVSILLYVAAWTMRGAETLLFLRLLGVEVQVAAAVVVETSLILVRALAVPVPAGLGVQDVGYVLSLKALGVPDAVTVGTAFVLLKRGKDLFWVLCGFVLLLTGGDRPRRAASSTR
jgi:hypothetical protein